MSDLSAGIETKEREAFERWMGRDIKGIKKLRESRIGNTYKNLNPALSWRAWRVRAGLDSVDKKIEFL